MNLLSNIQYTFNSIFEFYKGYGKKYAGFSMVFVIFSSIACIILSVITVAIHDTIIESPSHSDGGLSGMLGENWYYYLTSQMLFFGTMSIGLYSFCLGLYQQVLPEKIAISEAFARIDPETWLYFFLSCLGGSILFFILDDMFILRTSDSSLSQLTDFLSTGPWIRWLRNITNYIRVLLPFVFLYQLTRIHLKKKGIQIAKGKRAFASVLILSFFITVVGNEVFALVQQLITYPMANLFTEMLVPVIVAAILYIFVIAQFYPGLAGAIIYPFLYSSEHTVNDNEIIDEP